jgi:hypothetical protein
LELWAVFFFPLKPTLFAITMDKPIEDGRSYVEEKMQGAFNAELAKVPARGTA